MIRLCKIFGMILVLSWTGHTGLGTAQADEPAGERYQTEISKHQARKLALGHLRALGYTRVGVSLFQARVGKASLSGQGWRVEARTSSGGLPHEPWLIYVDGQTGEILRAYPVAQ